MTLTIRDRAVHNESRSRVIRRIAYGADLLVGCGEKNWGLNKVLCIGTQLQNKTGAGRVESKVQTVGYGVGWVRGNTCCST